ncbi:aspartate--tRNA ligase [Candidatus Woesearchaeota archaeon]|nr:aspartate--tRNA ligase [Candidatus Woesearchaeota archaeon]
MENMKTSYRSHSCGGLSAKEVDAEVSLAGWVDTRRDHGGVIFIDLRDREGLTQIVFNPEFNKDAHGKADQLRREDVIQVKGTVKKRAEGMANPRLKTGEIEVFISELNIINKSETPPIEIDDKKLANEDLRLKYRYLDLRRQVMKERLIFRHKVVTAAREYFNSQNFIEMETPLMVKSTPEGARDYVVPSRVNPGKFYALPQSPQLYKQILMIAGFDRYYQVAKCLRDEDLRQDRQPEHTQFDFEMSFVSADDIRAFVEGLMKHIFKTTLEADLEKFPILTYKESMGKYGTDKPDIRFKLELCDVTDIVVKSDFGVFKDVKNNGGIIKCINPEKDLGRKEIDGYISFCQDCGAKGMAWMRVGENGLESNIAKYFPEDIQKELIGKVGAKPGSILMFIADKEKKCNDVLSRLRVKLGEDLGLINKDEFKFLWVYDFPLFAFNEEVNRWEPEHHMFSMPKQEFIETFDKDPKPVIGDLWDLVLNGTEMGSGSIRISNPEIQERIMKLIGMSKEEANEKFGFLLEAYKYGGPVHGGMGLGVDRIVAMMKGITDIREVITFPKNKNAQCPMDDCPSDLTKEQLKELSIKTDIPK